MSTADPQEVIAIARKNGIDSVTIGATLKSSLVIRNRNKVLVDCRVDELAQLWDTGLVNLLHDPVLV